MVEGVVVQNHEGKIVDCSPGASRILGLEEDEVNGRFSSDPSWHAIREDGCSKNEPVHLQRPHGPWDIRTVIVRWLEELSRIMGHDPNLPVPSYPIQLDPT